MTTCQSSPNTIKTKETARIAIIGSGPAGIAAATRLLEQGFKNVTILEAENRFGGRVNTIPFADNRIDLGAQWCHGEEGNVVYEKMKDLEVLHKDGEIEGVQFVRSNKEVISLETSEAFSTLADNCLPKKGTAFEGSLGDFVTKKYWEDIGKMTNIDRKVANEFLECFKKYQCSVDGCDHLFEVSGRSDLGFVECPGDQSIDWGANGYITWLRHLLNTKAEKLDDQGVLTGHVELNKRVVNVNWKGPDEIILRCWNGELITFDHVICTVSLGVLKEQHKTLFTPGLPEAKVRAIKALKLGTVDKFIMEFEKSPLPEDSKIWNFLWREEDLQELRGSKYFWLESVMTLHNVNSQPRLLEGWIIGEHARYMETLTSDEVLEGLMWLFRKFLPFNVPQPTRFIRTQWYSNPNFRGSYSFRTTYSDELRTGPWDLASPLMDLCGKPRVQFAGEASSKDHHSTVHGATETGWREADRLNDFYSQGTSVAKI